LKPVCSITLTNAARATVNCEIISPDGKSAAKFRQAGQVGGGATASREFISQNFRAG
jgi:hypothetical protein